MYFTQMREQNSHWSWMQLGNSVGDTMGMGTGIEIRNRKRGMGGDWE